VIATKKDEVNRHRYWSGDRCSDIWRKHGRLLLKLLLVFLQKLDPTKHLFLKENAKIFAENL
jgi:hypothetical protein